MLQIRAYFDLKALGKTSDINRSVGWIGRIWRIQRYFTASQTQKYTKVRLQLNFSLTEVVFSTFYTYTRGRVPQDKGVANNLIGRLSPSL